MEEAPVADAKGVSGSTDTNFHGDIRLLSNEGELEEYVARFTHGTLEWIRPLADFMPPTQG